jgi:hypothetical protein
MTVKITFKERDLKGFRQANPMEAQKQNQVCVA